MPKKISIITGPIVGLQSTWLIEDTIKFCEAIGEKVVLFNLFDEIFTHLGLQPRNAYEKILYIGEILDGYSYQFKCMREKAYLSIARKIDKLGKNVNVIIRIPASIEWRGYNLILKDHRIISEVIKPNAIVTLIDAEWKIKERLKSNYSKRVLQIIAQQDSLSITRILEWLASEVSISEDWQEWTSYITKKKVQHIVLGILTPTYRDRKKYIGDVDNLAKLATCKDVPTFYASYSMTVASERIRRQINSMIWKLRAYGIVIDPASIELGKNVDNEHELVVFTYTVCRDLRWDVQKVDIVVAFHPYKDNPPLSTGMMDELGHARAFRKDRYLILPVGAGSPFTKDNYVAANHVFKTANEFFDFIENKRRPVLKPKYEKFQRSFRKWQDKQIDTRLE